MRKRVHAGSQLSCSLTASCVLALAACFEPGDIPDADEFYAAVAERSLDGGPLGDAALPPANGDRDSGGSDQMPIPGCGDVQQTVFAEKCTNPVCHGDGNVLDLESAGLPARLLGGSPVGVCEDERYVDPAAPEDSLIYAKLTMDPPCGTRMPLGGVPLSDDELACVLEYVTQVALDADDLPVMDAGSDASTDTDPRMDGATPDPDDNCADDPDKIDPGVCGCGVPDDDRDGDGSEDCIDECPDNPAHQTGPCPGLLEGSLAGAFNLDDDNPGNLGIDPLGVSRSETKDWPENTTYVFNGEIYIGASGAASFFENIDDSVFLEIDGQVLINNGIWNEPTSGTIMRAEGWYPFELRLGNGETASGPSGDLTFGFGYAPSDTMGSTDPNDYEHPANSDAASLDLFRYDE